MNAVTPTVPETEEDIARLMMVAKKLGRIRVARPQLVSRVAKVLGLSKEQAAADIPAILALVHQDHHTE